MHWLSSIAFGLALESNLMWCSLSFERWYDIAWVKSDEALGVTGFEHALSLEPLALSAKVVVVNDLVVEATVPALTSNGLIPLAEESFEALRHDCFTEATVLLCGRGSLCC